MGSGMRLVMTDIGKTVGITNTMAAGVIIGIIVGIVGIAGVAAAYPLCVYITKKERQRIAPEILKLSDELLK